MMKPRKGVTIVRLTHPDTFVSKRPEENDREEVLTTSGNLLYNTETDKFLSTLNGELSWEDQSAYFVPNKNTGHADEEKFNRVVKFVTVEEGMQSVMVPSTAYRQRKTAFRYDVFVETNFGLAFPYVKFLQEQARDSSDPLNQREIISVDPALDGGDMTVINVQTIYGVQYLR